MDMDTGIIIRFVRLFVVSTLIVALAWMLLENQILGGIRDAGKDILYAALIAVCISCAQVALNPRSKEAAMARMAARRAGAASKSAARKKKGKR